VIVNAGRRQQAVHTGGDERQPPFQGGFSSSDQRILTSGCIAMLANQNAEQQHAGNPDIRATGNGAQWCAGKFGHHRHRIASLHGEIWTPTYPSQHPNGIMICSATSAPPSLK